MTDKDFTLFPSPCYIMEEGLLRKNLALIKSVADRAGVEIILAFKSFAMWRSFPVHFNRCNIVSKARAIGVAQRLVAQKEKPAW